MPLVTTTVCCDVPPSFRVSQVAGMFDVPLADKCRQTFSIELPDAGEDWRIGAIVGPSGSGKTTLARAAYGAALRQPGGWPSDRAVIDGFGGASLREITHTLTAVGFSSPPSWVRPYHVLSNGEKFRCDLARALLAGAAEAGAAEAGASVTEAGASVTEAGASAADVSAGRSDGLIVFDEFTSVVDRVVARFGSAAVSKALRSGRLAARFVAVSCHYDILEWLEPDWVADLATGRLTRGRLRRPEIVLEVSPCAVEAWPLFARHHYLSAGLPAAARCYLASWDDRPAAFCATASVYGHPGRRRVARVVTLPDFQGLGVGTRLMELVCQRERAQGARLSVTASHPAMLAHCQRSPRWRAARVSPVGNRGGTTRAGRVVRGSRGRGVASFEFVG